MVNFLNTEYGFGLVFDKRKRQATSSKLKKPLAVLLNFRFSSLSSDDHVVTAEMLLEVAK